MYKILLLPGDGIGPEVVAQARKVLACLVQEHELAVELEEAQVGGSAYALYRDPLPDETLKLARSADAVMLGAVGGPQFDHLDRELRPEKGLLRLRAELDLFANLRPAIMYPALDSASSLKPEHVTGLDILIIRELTGGIYFGEPRGIRTLEGDIRQGFNTLVYSEDEIARIAHIAFRTAQKRNHRLCSVDKANVLEVSELWRDVVGTVHQGYPDVSLSHMYVDNAAMQLVKDPNQFDVVLTDNMFGDILSDIAAMLTGSIGMLPSASLNEKDQGMYEPVHGSAPDIAGKDRANPLATILSVAMMLRYSLNESRLAGLVEQAVHQVIAQGYRTADIVQSGQQPVGTEKMGNAVIHALLQVSHNN
ncbi:MAG: 3-isopropylmalate dehydrogenase [Gammaproteobacteria bacterium]|nr:3-isopropylmalate dehydrogenase [Gammaproteobacteria bacterium]